MSDDTKKWIKALEASMNNDDDDLHWEDLDANYMFDPKYDPTVNIVDLPDLDDEMENDMPPVDDRCDCHLVTGFHEDWIMAVQEQVDNLKTSLWMTQAALAICGIILLVRF